MEVNEKELEAISESRVEIKEIKYEGVVRTKKDVFEYYLESSRKQKRFMDVLLELKNAMFCLQNLNLFDSLTFTLSLPEKDPGKVPPSKLQPLQLLIKVKENHAHGGFNIGINNKGEKAAHIEGHFSNVLGRAETASLTFDGSLPLNYSFTGSFTKPFLFWGSKNQTSLTITSRFVDESTISNYREYLNGIGSSFGFVRNGSTHEIGWEGVCRTVFPTPQASLDIRRGGNSLKSAIRYSYSFDTRNDTLVPMTGYSLKFTSEFAGLGGNVTYWKDELQGNVNVPLLDSLSLGLQVRGGYISPLKENFVRISDRFFLLGSSLRGFDGIDPSPIKGEPSGGEVYFSTYSSLLFPLVTNFSDLIYGHIYLNYGNISNRSTSSNLKHFFRDSARAAVGIGLIFKTSVGRLELNFNTPLKSLTTDKPLRFQWGFFTSI
jgi:outer membrane protein insertion porin family